MLNFPKLVDKAQENTNTILFIIVLLGISLRLFLATGPYNLDLTNFIHDYEIYTTGGNLYKLQPAYNYSPLFYYILIVLGKISENLPSLSLPFLIRAFLTLVDLATLFVLLKLAKIYKTSIILTATAFFLNPVSIIITGHHGQFENISLLFLLTALFIYEMCSHKLTNGIKGFILIFLVLAISIKHVLIFHPIVLIKRLTDSLVQSLVIYGLILGFFLLTFLPFLLGAFHEIYTQVFKYDGLGGLYGISHLYLTICRTCSIGGFQFHHLYKYFFIFMLFVVSLRLKQKNIIHELLLLTLLFLAFTPGIGAQFFILPIAFGALVRSKWFYYYSIVVTLFYFSNPDEMYLYPFQFATWNTVWLFVILWLLHEVPAFIAQHRNVHKK